MAYYTTRMLTPSPNEPTLTDLAEATGIEPRTIRSWITQGLLPSPLNRGPLARYPAETLQRLLAIQAMRELFGMSLTDIRKELMVATPEQIAEHASKASSLPARIRSSTTSTALQEPTAAYDYIAELRSRSRAPQPSQNASPYAQSTANPTGFDALERHLGQGKPGPMRRSRAEEWLKIPITPDLELSARGPLDGDQRARLERCASLIRNILLGS